MSYYWQGSSFGALCFISNSPKHRILTQWADLSGWALECTVSRQSRWALESAGVFPAVGAGLTSLQIGYKCPIWSFTNAVQTLGEGCCIPKVLCVSEGSRVFCFWWSRALNILQKLGTVWLAVHFSDFFFFFLAAVQLRIKAQWGKGPLWRQSPQHKTETIRQWVCQSNTWHFCYSLPHTRVTAWLLGKQLETWSHCFFLMTPLNLQVLQNSAQASWLWNLWQFGFTL